LPGDGRTLLVIPAFLPILRIPSSLRPYLNNVDPRPTVPQVAIGWQYDFQEVEFDAKYVHMVVVLSTFAAWCNELGNDSESDPKLIRQFQLLEELVLTTQVVVKAVFFPGRFL
jgi:hypothetical protein